MTTMSTPLGAAVWDALGTVADPELDEPITDLGFVRSVRIDDDGIEVHLRLPSSFCAPNFAYLMASDALDALRGVPAIGEVTVRLDDHHDSDKINAGLAADAGYRGTFGGEAADSLDQLRLTFLRKAHTAAMERSVERLLRSSAWTLEELGWLTLADLPASPSTEALIRRRRDIGLRSCGSDRVLVDDTGTAVPFAEIPLRLRFAKSVRISIDGNAHFCRGLLATRYEDSDPHGLVRQVTNTRRST
ncbi:metal-sulfur cluster assembly factor [Nakamurella leprariae]|uniref:Iron-sulfur cluster assembly protein n=1 Tax=Nakamurella leprariae TaxID=2803911 RepID=A0A938YDU3_9ACTN|nr:iron-sulfur cluster assembly protein [Nakamurella leprariae]MBM9465933.1 iron-sulfur cluster assembly protein [Nakamurella leprariae]